MLEIFKLTILGENASDKWIKEIKCFMKCMILVIHNRDHFEKSYISSINEKDKDSFCNAQKEWNIFQGRDSFAKLFNVNGKCAPNCKEFYIMYPTFVVLKI